REAVEDRRRDWKEERASCLSSTTLRESASDDAERHFPRPRRIVELLARSPHLETGHEALDGPGDLTHRGLENCLVVRRRLSESRYLAHELAGGRLDVLGWCHVGAFP